ERRRSSTVLRAPGGEIPPGDSPRGGIPEQGGRRSVPGGTRGTTREIPPGTAPRKDAPSGVRSVCGRRPEETRSREARDVQLSRLHAHLREEEKQWTIHGGSANDPQAVAGQTE